MSAQGTVFTYQMPYGIPGRVNRVGGGGKLDIEAQIMDPESPVPFYGCAGMIDADTGEFRAMADSDTAIYGFLMAPYPTQPQTAPGFSGEVPLGTAPVPPTTGVIDVMKSGYMTTQLFGATAAVKNGAVWIRIAASDSTHPLGGVEAADAGGGDTIAVNAYFTGPADANGNVEIAFSISAKP